MDGPAVSSKADCKGAAGGGEEGPGEYGCG